MPSISLSYVNIALDAFALVILLIIFTSCLSEFSPNKNGARHFLLMQGAAALALVADILGWLGEGNTALSVMTTVSNTVASCACQIVILGFMGYLIARLYANSRAASCILNVFRVLCVCSLSFCIGNAFLKYAFEVNAQGHYVRGENEYMSLVYLIFPLLSFVVVLLLTILAKEFSGGNRINFIVYTLFPVAGVIIDYTVHGLSLTYLGFTVSVLTIYTGIYLSEKKQLEEQRNALMLSQINPHFVYNTLSTIAAMCDTSPKQAKYLTIDFSRYLRRNIDTLSSKELISFEQEMDHVACYLKIEKARFRERLNVNYNIQCKDFSLPPLTVQPLVENAVKHGITKRTEGGTIRISTRDEETHYVIEIIDDGIGFDTETAETHVGIRSVRDRIATMCKGELSIKSTLGVGTRVTISIPKKRGERR